MKEHRPSPSIVPAVFARTDPERNTDRSVRFAKSRNAGIHRVSPLPPLLLADDDLPYAALVFSRYKAATANLVPTVNLPHCNTSA